MEHGFYFDLIPFLVTLALGHSLTEEIRAKIKLKTGLTLMSWLIDLMIKKKKKTPGITNPFILSNLIEVLLILLANY